MGFLFNGRTLCRGLQRLTAEARIDVLEGPELSLAPLMRTWPPTKIIRMHGGHHFFATTLGVTPRPWRCWLEKRSFCRAAHLCAVSRFVAETTRRVLELGERRIEILPNPVDTDRFCPRRDIPEDPGLIIFVGTVCEKKGVRQLVQAMPTILTAVPHAQLWIIGRDLRDAKTNESFIDGLRRQIAPEAFDHIHFKGIVENAALPLLLARGEILVYPSHMEAHPVAWLEGLAMGKPVVASETGPGSEIIEDGVSGLLCDPHNPHSIAEAVIRALKDRELRMRLGAAARTRAVSEFSMDKLVIRNLEFYRHCLESRIRQEHCPPEKL